MKLGLGLGYWGSGPPPGLAEKVAATGEPVGIRRDARWSVPEPELALVLSPQLQLVGDNWAKSESSAVLRVPSAVIEKESNYLLNPSHRDFGKIKIGTAEPLTLDLRLVE